jgi:hypothetical protein
MKSFWKFFLFKRCNNSLVHDDFLEDVIATFRNITCMQPMKQLNIHPRGFIFFPLGKDVCEDEIS